MPRTSGIRRSHGKSEGMSPVESVPSVFAKAQ